jgi:polysaccharide export outer membrane protein
MIQKISAISHKLFFAALIFCWASCGSSKKVSQDYTYFQYDRDSLRTVNLTDAIIQPNDLLSIQVFSKTLNQEQAALFNIPNAGTTGYLVRADGNIEIPKIGIIKAIGLNRIQLADALEKRLSDSGFVKEPSVLVRFLQFKVNVIGEVKSPGSYNFATERVTLIDALSAAGDLTEYGKRAGVVVIRQVDDNKVFYPVDLRSTKLFQSPAFLLQQNDIVYVEATKNKLKRLDENPRAQRSLSNVLTIASFAAFIANLIITFR